MSAIDEAGVHPEFFCWGGADPDAIYDLCFILKIVIKIML
jgi:hypothetical protein